MLGNTSGIRAKSEIIVFIKTRLIRNSMDAGAVTEEFRERLQSMRRDRTVINGTGETELMSDLDVAESGIMDRILCRRRDALVK